MARIPDELAAATVQDEQGQEHRFGDFWRERTVVLVFVRHFG